MKKIAYILTLVLSLCSMFMFGCTNKYKNLKLELDVNEISIEVNAGEESFETVTATVKGAGKGVSTAVVFSTQSTNITLQQLAQEGNSTQCKIIATPNGTGNSATVTVATVEGGKTATINVNIVRAITSATYNTAYNPAVSLNGRLRLDTGIAINMVPENTTQDQFTYELVETYEGVSLSAGGELVVGSVMPTDGKINIKATNTEKSNIIVEFAVSVVKGIGSREQVIIEADGETIESLTIAPNIQVQSILKFSTTMGEEESYYSFHVALLSDNVLSSVTSTANVNEYSVVANAVGETKLIVTVFVTGFDKQFASFTFEIPVKVKNVPTGITATTTDNASGLSSIIGEHDILQIYDVYADGILGTQLTTLLTPTPTESEDSTYSINFIAEANIQGMIDILYSDESKLESLTGINNSVDLFIKVNKETTLTEIVSFQIELVSDFNPEIKKVVNAQLIKGISTLKVSKETQEVSEIKIIQGESVTLTVSAKGSNNEELEVTTQNVNLDFGTTGANYVSAQRNTEDPAEFVITANNCGTANIVFYSNNGVKQEILVIVYLPYKAFTANFAMPNSDIGEQTYVDADSKNSVKTLVFAVSASLRINISYFSDENKTEQITPTILDAYITSGNASAVAVFNKLYIIGLKAQEISNLTLTIVSYDENGEIKIDTLSFTAKGYVPLAQVQLNHNNITLLDSGTLSALDRSEGEVILELRLSPINATFENNNYINWSVAGATKNADGIYVTDDGHKVTLNGENLRSNQVKVSVVLSDTKNNATVTIVATATQYTRTYTQDCVINVQKCVQIQNVEITNLKNSTEVKESDEENVVYYDYDLYFNATKGLANVESINEIATSEGAENYFDLKTRISPANVTNSNVVYVVKNWDKANNEEITNSEKDVVLVSSEGRVFANTAGWARIYVIPADCLTDKTESSENVISYNGKEYAYNEKLAKIIFVQVADGSKDNKIRIQSASDFIGINTINGLGLHYELRENIDLSSVGTINPIGYVSINNEYQIAPFTGSIDGKFNNYNFTLSNVRLNMVAYKGAYVGLFAEVQGEINNLRVYVNSITHSLAQNSTAKFGVIASTNNGTIKNCEVIVNSLNLNQLAGEVAMGVIAAENNGTISNTRVLGDISLSYTAGIRSIKFGAIAGLNSGTISGMKAQTATTQDEGENTPEFVASYNFSDVDVMLNITTANANIKINEEEDFAAVNFGGVTGENTGTVDGVSFGGILKGYSKLGGISGLNSGTISHCVNQGNVYSQGGSYTGGIVAYNTNNTAGAISNNSVQAFNSVGKIANHTAIVGYNYVGGIVGYNYVPQGETEQEIISNCYCLSYYSLRSPQKYETTSNYETDNVYYGDMLILNANGVFNALINGITQEANKEEGKNYCEVYYQVIGGTPQKLIIKDEVNTVPTSITASVSENLETTFAAQPTKQDNSTILLPFFEELNSSNAHKETIYDKNTHKIADLIKVSCTPTNATQKFIVQSSNSSVVSLDKQGKLHVVGLGKATLTISSIFNSCEAQTIEVITSYPVGELAYVNASGNSVESLTLRKSQNALLTPVMTYSFQDDNQNTIECKVSNQISINAESANEDYAKLNASSFKLNASIIVSALEKTSGVNLTFTPSLTIEGKNVTTSLSEKIILVSVSEGATDVVFSQNNLETSQTDVIEFTVYVNTDVSEDEFSVNGSAFENLIYTDSSEKLTVVAGEPDKLDNLDVFAIPFTVKLADPYQSFAEDANYIIEFADSTISDRTFEFNFKVKAQKVESVHAANYNGITDSQGILTYKEPDNSNSITPGQTAILEIDVYPFYANVGEITIINTGASEDKVTFEQVVRTGIVTENTSNDGFNYSYRSLFPRADYIENGIKALPISKITGIANNSTGATYTHDDTNYLFDGKIYLKTLIRSGVSEGSKYELTITVTTLENIKITKVITLTAVNSLSIGMTYSYQMEDAKYGDYKTVEAITNKDNAPKIYLPAGVANCGGTLSVVNNGYSGEATISFDSTSTNSFDSTSKKPELSGSNPYTISTNGCKVGDSGTILATINIPLANGTNVEQTVYLNYQIVDIVIPNLTLENKSAENHLGVLDIRVGGDDVLLNINNDWNTSVDYSTLINTLTKSKSVAKADETYEISGVNALERYWYVVNGETKDELKTDYLGESLVVKNKVDGSGLFNTTHYLSAKNTLANKTIGIRFGYYYENGCLKLAYMKGNDFYRLPTETETEENEASRIINTAITTVFAAQAEYTTQLDFYTSEDLPYPVSTAEEFLNMQAGHHYILVRDITLTDYEPISTQIASFDGNGFRINLESFADYSADQATELKDSVNIGLFTEVSESSILKNIKVVINSDLSAQLNLTNTYRSVNYGTIAAINNGVITNCSVSFENIEYDSDNKEWEEATTASSDYKIEITTDESLAGDLVNNIGGLVAINNGYVTNSRVEQPINIIVNTESYEYITENGVTTGTVTYTPKYITSAVNTCVSTIKGNGNVAGLIATNAGIISSCYVKGVEIINHGAQSSSKNTTGGLVGENSASGKILYSYIEGTFEDLSTVSNLIGDDPRTVRATGDGIISNGNIGAFNYLNKGYISNCYANIKVTTNARASGFVYDTSANGSLIESCFTLSSIEQYNNAHNPFTGTSTTEVLANNNVSACYYLRIESAENGYTEDFGNTSAEPANEIGLQELSNMGTFSTYSFVTTDKETDENKYIWRMSAPSTLADISYTETDEDDKDVTATHAYPQLITANQITLSMRKIVKTDESGSEDSLAGGQVVNGYPVRGGNDEISNVNSSITTKLKVYNPLIVANQQDYENIMANAANSATTGEKRKVLNVTIRFVRDIEFDNTLDNSPSANIIFKGALDGNGMSISNIRVNTNNIAEGQKSLGFFSELNGNPDSNLNIVNSTASTFGATIKNLSFEFTEVYGNTIDIVGGVVGKVENGFLLNITVSGKDVVAVGKNITGGVFGAMLGGSRAVNLESSLSVSSEYRTNQNVESAYNLYNATYQGYSFNSENEKVENNINPTYYETTITNQSSISYAGGVGGVVDIYGTTSSAENAQTDLEDIIATGTANVLGENVGGIFGLVGANTKIATAYNIISSRENSLFATKVAGGLVGELRGSIERSKIEHEQQSLVEQTDLGRVSASANTNYFKGTCQAIGGIAGFLNGGTIKNSYSKIDVRNSSAQFAGGAVGRSLCGVVSYTYASGSVLGIVTGGFVGHVAEAQTLKGIENKANNDKITGLNSDIRENTALSFNVAVNNWLFSDYEQAVLKGNAFNTFIGAITEDAKLALTDNHATAIMFSNAFNKSTKISVSNGKLFASDANDTDDNYCIIIAGNNATEKELISNPSKHITLTLHHPAKMVETRENQLENETSVSAKEDIYARFSSVLWTGKDDEDLRYIELINRSELFKVGVSNWQELESAIKARNKASISLKNDIVVEGIITNDFTGTLEGNGYSFVFVNAPEDINSEEAKALKEKYGENVNFEDSKLHNAVVKVGSRALSNETNLVEQYCFGVFALTSGAWLDNVNVRLEKDVEADLSTLAKGTNNRDTAYIGLLVAYATDNTSFNNCYVYSETNNILEVIGGASLSIANAGALVGQLESSTILSDFSVDIQQKPTTQSLSTFAVRNQNTHKLTNGIKMDIYSASTQLNVGGLVGASSKYDAVSKIMNITQSYTSVVKITAGNTTGKTQNNIGGIVGNASYLNMSTCSFYGSIDNGKAKTTTLQDSTLKNPTKFNSFGAVFGNVNSKDNVSVSGIIVETNSEYESEVSLINKAYLEIDILAGTGTDNVNVKDASENKFNLTLNYNYKASGTSTSDAENKFQIVNNKKIATTFENKPVVKVKVNISVNANTDQVIAVNPNKEYLNEHYKADTYLYGGGNPENTYSFEKISTPLTLKTYYRAGTYIYKYVYDQGDDTTDSSETTTITKMNINYVDRPVLIPEYLDNYFINEICYQNTFEYNAVRDVFKDVTQIKKFISLNKNYFTDGLGLYSNNSIHMFAKDSDEKEYKINSAYGVVDNGTFKGSTKLESITIDNIVNIGASAFENCTAITEITGNNVTVLGKNAFKGCSALATVTMNSLNEIKDLTKPAECVFAECVTLNSITMQNLTKIGDYGLSYIKSLTTISMPKLETVGDSAFSGCSSLTTANGNEQTFSVSYQTDGGEKNEGIYEFDKNGNQTLVEYSSFPNLKEIGSSAFADTAFKNLYLPKARIIHSVAFSGVEFNDLIIAAEYIKDANHQDLYIYDSEKGVYKLKNTCLPDSEDKGKTLELDSEDKGKTLEVSKQNAGYGRINLASNVGDEEIAMYNACFSGMTCNYLTTPLSTYVDDLDSTEVEKDGLAYSLHEMSRDSLSNNLTAENWYKSGNMFKTYTSVSYAFYNRLYNYKLGDQYGTLYDNYIAITGKIIPDEAFLAAAVTTLNICSGVETIGKYAFTNCAMGNKLILPSTIENLAEGFAFAKTMYIDMYKKVGGDYYISLDPTTGTTESGSSSYEGFAENKDLNRIYINKNHTNGNNIGLTTIASAKKIQGEFVTGNTAYGGFASWCATDKDIVDITSTPIFGWETGKYYAWNTDSSMLLLWFDIRDSKHIYTFSNEKNIKTDVEADVNYPYYRINSDFKISEENIILPYNFYIMTENDSISTDITQKENIVNKLNIKLAFSNYKITNYSFEKLIPKEGFEPITEGTLTVNNGYRCTLTVKSTDNQKIFNPICDFVILKNVTKVGIIDVGNHFDQLEESIKDLYKNLFGSENVTINIVIQQERTTEEGDYVIKPVTNIESAGVYIISVTASNPENENQNLSFQYDLDVTKNSESTE